MHWLFIDMREYKSNSFVLADLYQVLECIHGSTVQSWNTAHTKDQALGKIFDNDMLDGICGAKEQWSGDLINTDLQRQLPEVFINIRCIVIGIYPAVYMSFLAHSLDEKQARKYHADLDGNDKVKDYCQYKGYQQYDDIALRCCFEQVAEGSPLTHIVGNDKKNCSDRRHRDHSCIRHQNDKYDDQCDGVDHSGDRSTSAIFDVGSSSCNCACCRDAAKECRGNVSGALCNKFHIRTMFAVDHSVSNYAGE